MLNTMTKPEQARRLHKISGLTGLEKILDIKKGSQWDAPKPPSDMKRKGPSRSLRL